MSTAPTGLELYSQTADAAAAAVIQRYSTSFGIAARLLGPRPRPHVRNIYALVRVADEIVDGPARDAGLSPERERQVLDGLEQEVRDAIATGFSANLVVHAFARTARECGIGDDLIAPFFTSMRTDIDTAEHDDLSHDAYVYGSAEVVGLMCLQVFLNAGMSAPAQPAADLVDGARRLGAAFQDVNFCATSPTTPTASAATTSTARPTTNAASRFSTASTPTSPPRHPSSPTCRPTAAPRSRRPTTCSPSCLGGSAPPPPAHPASAFPTVSKPPSPPAPCLVAPERFTLMSAQRIVVVGGGIAGLGNRRPARRPRIRRPALRGP